MPDITTLRSVGSSAGTTIWMNIPTTTVTMIRLTMQMRTVQRKSQSSQANRARSPLSNVHRKMTPIRNRTPAVARNPDYLKIQAKTNSPNRLRSLPSHPSMGREVGSLRSTLRYSSLSCITKSAGRRSRWVTEAENASVVITRGNQGGAWNRET